MDFLSILVNVLPDLGKVVLGGKGSDLINIGSKVAKEVFGTDDPKRIQEDLSNPATLEIFKIRLASETERLRAEIEDVQDARRQTIALAQSGSSIAWGPVVLSVIITLGFIAVICIVLFRPIAMDERQAALVQILAGALTAAFIQVCNYWLGSSSGSKRSGDAVRSIAEASIRRVAG